MSSIQNSQEALQVAFQNASKKLKDNRMMGTGCLGACIVLYGFWQIVGWFAPFVLDNRNMAGVAITIVLPSLCITAIIGFVLRDIRLMRSRRSIKNKLMTLDKDC